jgi:hypothetical protein
MGKKSAFQWAVPAQISGKTLERNQSPGQIRIQRCGNKKEKMK